MSHSVNLSDLVNEKSVELDDKRPPIANLVGCEPLSVTQAQLLHDQRVELARTLHRKSNLPLNLQARLVQDVDGGPHYRRISDIDHLSGEEPNSSYWKNCWCNCFCCCYCCSVPTLVDNNHVGRAQIHNEFRFLLPGYHRLPYHGGKLLRPASIVMDHAITNGNSDGFVIISEGHVGVMKLAEEFRLLAPGVYEWRSSPSVDFVGSVEITSNDTVQLGPFTLVTVPHGSVQVSYDAGEVRLLGGPSELGMVAAAAAAAAVCEEGATSAEGIPPGPRPLDIDQLEALHSGAFSAAAQQQKQQQQQDQQQRSPFSSLEKEVSSSTFPQLVPPSLGNPSFALTQQLSSPLGYDLSDPFRHSGSQSYQFMPGAIPSPSCSNNNNAIIAAAAAAAVAEEAAQRERDHRRQLQLLEPLLNSPNKKDGKQIVESIMQQNTASGGGGGPSSTSAAAVAAPFRPEQRVFFLGSVKHIPGPVFQLTTQIDTLDQIDVLSRDHVELILSAVVSWQVVDPKLAVVRGADSMGQLREKVRSLTRALLARIVAATTVSSTHETAGFSIGDQQQNARHSPSHSPSNERILGKIKKSTNKNHSSSAGGEDAADRVNQRKNPLINLDDNDDDDDHDGVFPAKRTKGDKNKILAMLDEAEAESAQQIQEREKQQQHAEAASVGAAASTSPRSFEDADLSKLMFSAQAQQFTAEMQGHLHEVGVIVLLIAVPEKRIKHDDIRREVAQQAVIGIRAEAERSAADAAAYARIIEARAEAEAIVEVAKAHAEAGRELGAPTSSAARLALSESTAKALANSNITIFSGMSKNGSIPRVIQ